MHTCWRMESVIQGQSSIRIFNLNALLPENTIRFTARQRQSLGFSLEASQGKERCIKGYRQEVTQSKRIRNSIRSKDIKKGSDTICKVSSEETAE